MFDLTLLQQNLMQKNPVCELRYNEPMSLHTSFRIGGCAEVMAFPKTKDQLAEMCEEDDLIPVAEDIINDLRKISS